MTTVKNIIVQAAKTTVEIFKKSGESYFKELKNREKSAVYAEWAEAGFGELITVDGDSDGYSTSISFDAKSDDRFVFFSSAEYYDDIATNLQSVQFELHYDDAPKGVADIEYFEYLAYKFSEPLRVVNLTPHDVVIVDAAGMEVKRYLTAGQMVRVNTADVPLDNVDNVPVVRTEYTDVSGLPDLQPNTVYLVSVLVAQALNGSRPDVYTPDTGPKSVVRDAQGHIIGVQRLMQL